MKRFWAHRVEGDRAGARNPAGIVGPKGRWLSGTFAWLLPDTRQRTSYYPPTPDGMIIYVIGDIHGRIDLLEELCTRIDRDVQDDGDNEIVEIYLGDYVDRGPASAKVIDRLVRRKSERKTLFLRGNHEKVLQDFFSAKSTLDAWRQIGGLETLISYGVDPDLLLHPVNDQSVRKALASNMPNAHRLFLKDLLPHHRAGSYFFVHAGVRPGIALDKQEERDCLWIREEFLDYDDDFGCIVVHGHSPVPEPEFLPNRINLDTAAYATGRLSCLKISQQGARLLDSDPDRSDGD